MFLRSVRRNKRVQAKVGLNFTRQQRSLSVVVRRYHMSEWQPLLNVIAGILLAIMTSWLTVKFALRRFKSEKWFELRIDAYTKVIESLHFMKHCTERQLDAEECGYKIAQAAEEKLTSDYRKGLAELRRLTDMGSLLFSAEAIAVLERLHKELNEATKTNAWWEHLDAESAAITKCLSELRVIAKKDLNA